MKENVTVFTKLGYFFAFQFGGFMAVFQTK